MSWTRIELLNDCPADLVRDEWVQSRGIRIHSIRPDSLDQDCEWFNDRKRTFEDLCYGDGHYCCHECKNFTPNPDLEC